MNFFKTVAIILTIIFISSLIQVEGSKISKRESNPIVSALIDAIEKLPLGGQLVSSFGVPLLNIITGINAIIGRFLGGALPCVVSINRGLWCSGVARSGGASELLAKSIDAIPPMVIPDPVKAIIKLYLRPVFNPIADLIFGGNKIQEDTLR